LGTRLSAVLNHTWVSDPHHETAHALLTLREEHYGADDIERLMSAAYADETVPADLRMLIADYLITEFWPSEVGAERDHAQNTYNEASDHALGGFNRNMQQLLDLAWKKEELVEQVLYFCKAKLDGDLIHEVERLQEERAARDESDEKEEGQPQVRDIRAALMQAQEEHAAGTLSPEREDAILSIFGPDFFSAGGEKTEPYSKPQ
jgi:hypothetical protein